MDMEGMLRVDLFLDKKSWSTHTQSTASTDSAPSTYAAGYRSLNSESLSPSRASESGSRPGDASGFASATRAAHGTATGYDISGYAGGSGNGLGLDAGPGSETGTGRYVIGTDTRYSTGSTGVTGSSAQSTRSTATGASAGSVQTTEPTSPAAGPILKLVLLLYNPHPNLHLDLEEMPREYGIGRDVAGCGTVTGGYGSGSESIAREDLGV
ncbi:hypothetical protein SUGI_0350930 [Cryptomeria japonica]|nr:hypothetical protein SUGI_0350930 [Cryptomeria japonica]